MDKMDNMDNTYTEQTCRLCNLVVGFSLSPAVSIFCLDCMRGICILGRAFGFDKYEQIYATYYSFATHNYCSRARMDALTNTDIVINFLRASVNKRIKHDIDILLEIADTT